MRKLITATACLMLITGAAALAQDAPRRGSQTDRSNAPSATTNTTATAPVGHRQPRAADVPNENGTAAINAEDAALDRKIKSICRGC